jgi:hypothetical protein
VTDETRLDAATALAARAELGSILLETASIEDYLEEFAQHAPDHIGAGTHCGITLRHRGHDRRAASSDARTARCDDVEVASGSGPCITSLDEQRTVVGAEVWEDERWVEWRAAAVRAGFRSAAALSASAGPDASIALNLYSEDEEPWDEERLVRAAIFTQQVARVMALCIRISEQTVINGDLTAAMASRSTIDDRPGHRDHHGAEPVLVRGGVRDPAQRLEPPQRQAARGRGRRRAGHHRGDAVHRPVPAPRGELTRPG